MIRILKDKYHKYRLWGHPPVLYYLYLNPKFIVLRSIKTILFDKLNETH